MSIATIEQLNARGTGNAAGQFARELENFLFYSTPPAERGIYDHHRAVAYTPELGQKWLDTVKQMYLNHRLGKVLRPWQIVDLTSGLDPAQPWVGMEYETGFSSDEAYAMAVEELWNNHANNTMDGEGYGKWSAELTFAPVNLSTFNTNEYNVDRVIQFSEDNDQLLLPYEPAYGTWGMHVNFSTPAMRANGIGYAENMALVFSASIDHMEYHEKIELFGRTPYGYFESRNDSISRVCWIEGKLFQTTTDREVWLKYKKTINNFISLALRCDEELGYGQRSRVITNMYELLMSDDPSGIEIQLGDWAVWPNYDDDDDWYEDDE